LFNRSGTTNRGGDGEREREREKETLKRQKRLPTIREERDS